MQHDQIALRQQIRNTMESILLSTENEEKQIISDFIVSQQQNQSTMEQRWKDVQLQQEQRRQRILAQATRNFSVADLHKHKTNSIVFSGIIGAVSALLWKKET